MIGMIGWLCGSYLSDSCSQAAFNQTKVTGSRHCALVAMLMVVVGVFPASLSSTSRFLSSSPSSTGNVKSNPNITRRDMFQRFSLKKKEYLLWLLPKSDTCIVSGKTRLLCSSLVALCGFFSFNNNSTTVIKFYSDRKLFTQLVELNRCRIENKWTKMKEHFSFFF